jgi:ribosomal protein S18 acetylase RimI-like enzyme
MDEASFRLPLVIREGVPADAAACGEIAGLAGRSGAYAARLPFARDALEATSPLPAEGRRRLVAERGARIVGLLDLEPERGYVRYLFVDPAAQGRGVVTRLLAAAEAAGAPALTAQTLSVNPTALRFFLRRGFRITGSRPEDWNGGRVVWLHLLRDRRRTQA